MKKAAVFVAVALATTVTIFISTKLLHSGFAIAGRCFA